MGKYIHKFIYWRDFNNAYNGQDYLEPWVGLTKQRAGVSQITVFGLNGTRSHLFDYIGTGKSDMNNNVYLWKDQASDNVVATFDIDPTTSSIVFLMPHEADTLEIKGTTTQDSYYNLSYNKQEDEGETLA